MARPASVRTAARGKGSGPSAASTAWKERVRRSPRTSGAPGSSSVQANTPAAARAASGRTSGRINRRQTWRRLAPASRAASSQAGPICVSAWADAIATSGTPLASPSQIQPSQPPQSPGEIQPPTATLGQASGGPSSPLSPIAPNTGGTTTGAKINAASGVRPQNRQRATILARPTPSASDPIATTLATATLFQRQSQTNGSQTASAIGNAETRTAPVGPRSSTAAAISPDAGISATSQIPAVAPRPSPRIESMPVISRSVTVTADSTAPRPRPGDPRFYHSRIPGRVTPSLAS